MPPATPRAKASRTANVEGPPGSGGLSIGCLTRPPSDADKNLGLKYFLNGQLVSDIVPETSKVATDTIDYVATDSTGLAATSTRTMNIDPAAPLPVPDCSASTTIRAASSSPAAVASSTVQ